MFILSFLEDNEDLVPTLSNPGKLGRGIAFISVVREWEVLALMAAISHVIHPKSNHTINHHTVQLFYVKGHRPSISGMQQLLHPNLGVKSVPQDQTDTLATCTHTMIAKCAMTKYLCLIHTTHSPSESCHPMLLDPANLAEVTPDHLLAVKPQTTLNRDECERQSQAAIGTQSSE